MIPTETISPGHPRTDPTSGPPIITAEDLRVAFGRYVALDGVTLNFGPGAHGLLGPNGAGKSTLVKVLLGLVRPDSGSGDVLGHSIHGRQTDLRHRVGYMPERDAHVPGMLVIDYVSMMGRLSGLAKRPAEARAHEVLTYVGLSGERYRTVDSLSAGNRQRAKLATALVHDPDLLLLDEPTNGMDPVGRREMLRLIVELRRVGISMLVSTHLLPDVQEVCDGVAIMAKGRVLRTGSVASLTANIDRNWKLQIVGDLGPFLAALGARGVKVAHDETQGSLTAQLPEHAEPRLFIEAAASAGVGLKEMRLGTRTLEEAFFEVIGEAPHAHS